MYLYVDSHLSTYCDYGTAVEGMGASHKNPLIMPCVALFRAHGLDLVGFLKKLRKKRYTWYQCWHLITVYIVR
jgi:hypothetical protein